MTAISRPPAPKASTSGMRRAWNSPTRHTSKYPTVTFRDPQSTLTVGKVCPLPGGGENGVGNRRPDTPHNSHLCHNVPFLFGLESRE